MRRLEEELGPRFTRSLNIADPRTMADIVAEAGLDRARFMADNRAGAGRDEVIADDKAAIEDGVRSIPTVIVPASGRALAGLAELAEYRAAIEDGARC
ncbi:MAG: DsbA family oxidoreductase [Candidatus Rokuibacteriota bacterium]